MARRPFPLVDVLVGSPPYPALGGAALLTHGTTINLWADEAGTVSADASLDEAGVEPVAAVVVDGVQIPTFYVDGLDVVYGLISGVPSPLRMLPADGSGTAGDLSDYRTAAATDVLLAEKVTAAEATAIAEGAVAASQAGNRRLRNLSAYTAADASAWVPLAELSVADLATGQAGIFSPRILFSGDAVGGIEVRFTPGGPSGNLFPDPYFAAGTSAIPNPAAGNTTSPAPASSTIVRGTSNPLPGKSHHLVWTANTGVQTNHQLYTAAFPCAVGETVVGRAWARTGAGASKNVRVDTEYLDSAGGTTDFELGPAGERVDTSAAYQESTVANPGPAPAAATSSTGNDTTQARLRIVWSSAQSGDVVHIGGLQIAKGPGLPDPDAGGDGLTADVEVVGAWTVDGGPPVPVTAYDDAAAFGGPGAGLSWLAGDFAVDVGGAGLENQLLQVEVRKAETAGGSTAVPARQSFAVWARST